MQKKLRLLIDLLPHKHSKILRYVGDHPSRILKIVPPLLLKIFRVTSTNLFEDDFRWDKSGEPIEFFAMWRIRDKKDVRTTCWTKVKVLGEQNSKDKKGRLMIDIHPYMITEFPYSNFIHKIFYRSYSYFFYGNQRRRYRERELILVDRLENNIREEFGIVKKEHRGKMR